MKEQTSDGSTRFTQTLALLWQARNVPTNERLAVRVMPEAGARLRAVAHGRGDFAIIDAATAAKSLPAYPDLTVVAVLWPDYLQALSRNPRVTQMGLPVQVEVWVSDTGAYAFHLLQTLTEADPAQQRLVNLVPADTLPDALDYAREPVLLVSAPAPLEEISAALQKDRQLHLLPFSDALLEEFKLQDPWLVTATLEKGEYPGLSMNLEVPALYVLLVGRTTLPAASVNKMLSTLYDKQAAAALFSPLFATMDSRMNAVFSKLFPFHPATARAYHFTPSVR